MVWPCSSRNMLLPPDDRKRAVQISKALFESKKLRKELSVEKLRNWVLEKLSEDPLLKVEYFQIVHADTLQEITGWEEVEKAVGCIAVRVGNIRLIDNIRYIS